MATVANHRMYGMNLVCATAKQYIFQKVRILPLLLGQSLWSRDGDVYEEFKGMSAFLDLMLDIICIWMQFSYRRSKSLSSIYRGMCE